MEQLRLAYYEGMVRQEACVELAKAAIIQDSYDKKDYPRSLDDLTEDDIREFFSEGWLNELEEEATFLNNNKEGISFLPGHLIILRKYKKVGGELFMEKMPLFAWGARSGSSQEELICDIIGACLLMPEDTLHHHVFKRKGIKQFSRIYQCPEIDVKLRLKILLR